MKSGQFAHGATDPGSINQSGRVVACVRSILILALVAASPLLLLSAPARAGDFCGSDCVISEDFDEATDGGGVVVGTLPTGWVNVSGENAGDSCLYGATGQFPDPCFDWWVSSGVPEFGGDQAPIQPPFDHTDGLGNFLFVNSDDNDNLFVDLLTPTFPLVAANRPYATFYLYSFDTGSSAPNSLQVDIMDAAGTSIVQSAVLTVADIGMEKWRPAFANLDGTPDGTYRLRFRWINGIDQRDEGQLHDIALDDFAVVANRQATGGEGGLVVRTHILPAPENNILQFLNETQGTATNPVETYTGISIALDNVIIYYDEQEDGYESNLSSPTQTGFVAGSTAPAPLNRSTQIWGDGYPQNGYPPGHPDDILSLGEVIILREPAIDVTTLDAVLDHDAGDIIASSDEVAITRLFWASGDETLNAGSIELFPTDRWGTDYRIPFGEDITTAVLDAAVSCNSLGNPGDNPFEEVALLVMADTDGTSITVDFNNGGTSNDFSTTLNRGESAFVGFNAGADGVDDINTGARVTATGGLVQVHAFTADEGSDFGSRYYTLLPFDQLSDIYLAPFESTTGGATEIVIYNPNPAPLIVDIFTGTNPAVPVASPTIPANGFDTFVLPTGSAGGASVATRVQSRTGQPIYAVVVMDACDDAHDWGGALLPDVTLTQAMLIPVGFGSDPTNAAVGNHSPVWATPDADTFIYVDFNGDLVPDRVDLNGDGDTNDTVDGISESTSNQGMSVRELQLIRIHDISDFDQSGTLVFTLDGAGFAGGDPAGRAAGANIAGGWGQDPDISAPGATPTGAPAIDVGTAFAPITFPSTLPVSISSFDSRDVSGGLEIRWTTVAETHNAGYVIYGDRGRGVERLTAAPIAAIDGDPTLLRAYRHVLPGMRSSELRDIAVVAVDYHGKEEVYGLFEPGRAYGEQGVSSPLDWRRISLQAEQRMAALRAVRQREPAGKGGSSELGRGPSAPVAVDLKVTSAGLQEVSYETLRAAGLDLNGVAVAQIAVTVNGRAVARDVVPGAGNAVRGPALSLSKGLQGNNASSFGPGSVIRFWGERPAMPEALYVEDLFYRIELDADRALPAGRLEAKPQGEVALPLHWVRENRDLRYHFATPLESPWFAAQLRADRDNVYRTELLVDPAVDVQAPGRLKLVLAGMTDYPEAPDHRVVVEVNGKQVADHRFDGLRVVELDLALSGGTLHAGANEVRVIAPGGTDAPFDLFAVDTIDLGYARAAIALDDRLRVEGVQGGSAALRIDGYSDGNTVAYARQGETLVALASSQFGRGTVQVPTLAGEADYWVSTRAAVHAPAVVDTLQAGDLLAGVDADFLVIVHPAFLPLDENEPHPLNSYLAHRRAEGWRPALFDVTELQRRYAGGMALPEAVTRFLAEADARLDYEHVLLVGGDSYDYRDLLGLGSISFIPTRYAATRFIRHTPADALLADLDGDGLADKALGRWPVRSIGDLESIVTKTLDWDAGMRGSTGAVWVTDSEDPRAPSFTAQAERMMQPLLGQQWPVDALDRVYFDQVAPRPGLSVAASARAELFESLEQGRPVTGFVGHGSPTMWTFQGLLRPNDLADLDNQGKPTLITTMACYTSYFVSPHNETVAHRWMNGYQLDAGGAPIPGAANGAVAIHGAATLSDYDHNERVAREVLNAQLDGATLGEAVQRGRARAKLLGLDDQVINWILLGDPTLRM
jgi:hypothetical protein